MSPKTKGIIISLVAIGFSWLCAWLGSYETSIELQSWYSFYSFVLGVSGLLGLAYSITELKD